MFLKENNPESTKKSKESKKMDNQEKCPLCCETMELDDLNFLPCPCGYKVCLFCWNRIRTDSDEKCPLCRRTYSENPAKFEPPSPEELLKLKNKKKTEDQRKKQKLQEDRKQLADLRVVKKNLVFVNDLPLNFNKDLKVYNRFLNIIKQAGQYKKVHVMNTSKNYAGQKATFARAYITYQRNEDAMKALKLFENLEFEGRELKLSLGTTKYCQQYIKNASCTNKECVYLHEQAESEASFNKDQIHAGKHIEYGQKVFEQYLNSLQSKQLNSLPEEKKLENQSQHCIEVKKDIIIENSINESSANQQQQQNNQTIQSESSSPSGSEDLRILKQLNEEPINNLHSQCDSYQRLRTLVNPSVNDNNTDMGHLNMTSKNDTSDSSFESRFNIEKEPNGKISKEEVAMHSRNMLTLEDEANLRSSFPNNYQNLLMRDTHHPFTNGVPNSLEYKSEFKDDCNLEFDPVGIALKKLNELVVKDNPKSVINPPLRTSKKQMDIFHLQQQQQQQQQQQLPVNNISSYKQSVKQKYSQQNVFAPNYAQNNISPNLYLSSRSQTSPVVDYYSPPFRAAVQPPVRAQPVTQAAAVSQRSQAYPLSIQLPNFSPSMVNGYSPQQYMSQISPQETYLLPQQHNQTFENFSQPQQQQQQQQFPNFEQIQPSPVFNPIQNPIQNPGMREYPSTNLLNMRIFRQQQTQQNQQQQQNLQQQSLQQQQQTLQQNLQQQQHAAIVQRLYQSPVEANSLNSKGNNVFIP